MSEEDKKIGQVLKLLGEATALANELKLDMLVHIIRIAIYEACLRADDDSEKIG